MLIFEMTPCVRLHVCSCSFYLLAYTYIRRATYRVCESVYMYLYLSGYSYQVDGVCVSVSMHMCIARLRVCESLKMYLCPCECLFQVYVMCG